MPERNQIKLFGFLVLALVSLGTLAVILILLGHPWFGLSFIGLFILLLASVKI
jgi:hypothetical protein